MRPEFPRQKPRSIAERLFGDIADRHQRKTGGCEYGQFVLKSINRNLVTWIRNKMLTHAHPRSCLDLWLFEPKIQPECLSKFGDPSCSFNLHFHEGGYIFTGVSQSVCSVGDRGPAAHIIAWGGGAHSTQMASNDWEHF